MDIRNIFKEISEQLLSEFRKTREIKHPGGKGDAREDAIREFLRQYLPGRYSVGRGEVITSNNSVSGELDIVIFDPSHCPLFIRSSSHSIFPIESVYGAISIKSHLDSAELRDAYSNIGSLKTILDKSSFTLNPFSGLAMGMAFPMPVTGIVAYGANRSLEAIAEQIRELDSALSDPTLRPDFVAVIGQGIIAPREPLRGEFNKFALPDDKDALTSLRATGRHTLLRLYMQVLRELNAVTLRPLELHNYDEMPRIIGGHRVGRNSRLVIAPDNNMKEAKVIRLNDFGVQEIVQNSTPASLRQHLLNRFGILPHGTEALNLDSIVYEYNPKNLPPMQIGNVQIIENGGLRNAEGTYQPFSVEIDGRQYAVDFGSLTEKYYDPETDFTVEELLSS